MSKTIFVHIPKNAGMTIRHSTQLRDKILVNSPDRHKSKAYTKGLHEQMAKTGDHHGNEHARWRDLNEDYRESNPAFAVIRNPWDRVVSRYFFAKKVIEVEQKESSRYANTSSFEAFLDERFKWGEEEYMWHRAVRGWYPAMDHITDEQGNVRCDCLRLENLSNDLIDYFDLQNMSRARNVTALNKGSYKDMYTPQTIQIIGDWYKADVDYFGFDFDTSAQKNFWERS
jgi:hypothetical protein